MSLSVSSTRPYMIAANTPLLENQELCSYLQTMDSAEIAQITAEEQRFDAEKTKLDQEYSWGSIFKDGCLAALGLGAVAGGSKYGYDHSSYPQMQNDDSEMHLASLRLSCGRRFENREAAEKFVQDFENRWQEGTARSERERLDNAPKEEARWFIVGALFAGVITVGTELGNYYSKKSSLESKYTSQINDARDLRLRDKVREIDKRSTQPVEENEAKQLHVARDYFEQCHLHMQTDLKNRVTVVHRYG